MKLVFLHHWLSWILLFDLCWDIRSEAVAAHTVLVGFIRKCSALDHTQGEQRLFSIAWLLCNQHLQLSLWVLFNSHTLHFCHQVVFTYLLPRGKAEKEFLSWKKVQSSKKLFRLSSCPASHLSAQLKLWSPHFLSSNQSAKYCLPFNLIH